MSDKEINEAVSRITGLWMCIEIPEDPCKYELGICHAENAETCNARKYFDFLNDDAAFGKLVKWCWGQGFDVTFAPVYGTVGIVDGSGKFHAGHVVDLPAPEALCMAIINAHHASPESAQNGSE